MANKARIVKQKRMMARALRMKTDKDWKSKKKFATSPKDKWKTRANNRCELTGRPRAYMRDFGISRHCFRELAEKGQIPGVRKSSW